MVVLRTSRMASANRSQRRRLRARRSGRRPEGQVPLLRHLGGIRTTQSGRLRGRRPIRLVSRPFLRRWVYSSRHRLPSARSSPAVPLAQQARLSRVDPFTQKIHCRACGRAFESYKFLAQHVGDAHHGANSADEAYLRAKLAEQEGGTRRIELGDPVPARGKRAVVTLAGFMTSGPGAGPRFLARKKTTPAPAVLRIARPGQHLPANPQHVATKRAAAGPGIKLQGGAAQAGPSLAVNHTQLFKGRQREGRRRKKPSKMKQSVLRLR